MKVQDKKVVGVRIEDGMRSILAEKARRNDRSLSKEIISRLRKSLEEELENGK
jgi:hypothetical protein